MPIKKKSHALTGYGVKASLQHTCTYFPGEN